MDQIRLPTLAHQKRQSEHRDIGMGRVVTYMEQVFCLKREVNMMMMMMMMMMMIKRVEYIS